MQQRQMHLQPGSNPRHRIVHDASKAQTIGVVTGNPDVASQRETQGRHDRKRYNRKDTLPQAKPPSDRFTLPLRPIAARLPIVFLASSRSETIIVCRPHLAVTAVDMATPPWPNPPTARSPARVAADPVCVGIGRAKGYIDGMAAFRRILVFALFLTFALGTSGYGMPSGMADNAMTAAMDGTMPDACDACADDMAKSACASPCLAAAILPDTSASPTLGAEGSHGGSLHQAPGGATTAPDPFPPKSFA
ncbi:MAG TPA: hypothetical protein VIN77_10010 [Aurantimonas sp.]